MGKDESALAGYQVGTTRHLVGDDDRTAEVHRLVDYQRRISKRMTGDRRQPETVGSDPGSTLPEVAARDAPRRVVNGDAVRKHHEV